MAAESLSPDAIIETYGQDAVVVVGNGLKMTLGQALAAEQLFCPADAEQRLDATKRMHYLANMLAAGGSLLPRHEFLAQPTD